VKGLDGLQDASFLFCIGDLLPIAAYDIAENSRRFTKFPAMVITKSHIGETKIPPRSLESFEHTPCQRS
jgi:hypothetical protein